ncbi:hypothetical protein PSEUBRA_004132 [Kalmanozyma brasiliensis GHG001]|uniref:uncharacterized protein n=1 Tax=Kalmanozyma brasiliensis (strain GHG001) TaxID=1365824 RepID=UPI002867B1FA|nr:uncharacterized protein PSEUBRA_004132 [Kalmanozyma brasiliensis GHG001]KAF6767344.1 hypothetical protein PSEUBRA_004132 [Kalmanozyma brasiliensis GHG001]
MASASTPTVHVALPPPCPALRRPLVPSSSSPSIPSSSRLPQISSSFASASSISSKSQPSLSRTASRNSHHGRPIDFANPFGEDDQSDVFVSSKRSAPSGQEFYSCRWRLRDKKGVLDPNGHQYCNAQLMTPDLLARHALTQHVETCQESAVQVPQRKIACKWDGCFNRHYYPADLAGHLVHDHLAKQLGLKYSCIALQCQIKTVLTSFEALDRHHAIYHTGSMMPGQLRPIWTPKSQSKPKLVRKQAELLAALRKLDLTPPLPQITVADTAHPKVPPLDEEARKNRDIAFKERYFDPLTLRSGEGQEGQPWTRLHRRLEKAKETDDTEQAVYEAIFRATTYGQSDLDRLCPVEVEIVGEPTLRAIEEGIERAQLYRVGPATSRTRSMLPLPPKRNCEVVLPESAPSDLMETICPESLASIRAEMDFDDSLDKQRRWADKVLRRVAPTSNTPAISTEDPELDSDPGDEAASTDRAEPLLFVPYHPASRCRFPLAEDDGEAETPRAVRLSPEAHPQHGWSGDHTSAVPSSASSPRTIPHSSPLAPVSRSGPLESAAQPTRTAKREREDDTSSLLNGHRPAVRIKLEDIIDLTISSDDEPDVPPAEGPARTPTRPTPPVPFNSAFVELEPNTYMESSPRLRRTAPAIKAEPRRGSAPTELSGKAARQRSRSGRYLPHTGHLPT